MRMRSVCVKHVYVRVGGCNMLVLFETAAAPCWCCSRRRLHHVGVVRDGGCTMLVFETAAAPCMLVLFETAAGYAIFKLLDEKKLQQTENLWKEFQTPEKANRVCHCLIEGKLGKALKKVLKVVAKEAHEELAVADAKLGGAIKDKLSLPCVYGTAVQELMRGIRSQLDNIIGGLPSRDITAMSLGLAHSLSRYKLKFSPDKVDTMIVQAISLLDDVDKELNNLVMRAREWYGWHFPELGRAVTDSLMFCKTVRII
uniref:nucleolar protein 58-like n=1 Tax=Myxine glutinosa TaxID=7769 RepID=UPI00358FBFB7